MRVSIGEVANISETPVIFEGFPPGKGYIPGLRSEKKARYAVCLIKHVNEGRVSFVRGVGILYSNSHHLFFTEIKSASAVLFYRSMYAASLTSLLRLSDASTQLAVLIADEQVPLTDPRFENVKHCLGYDYERLGNPLQAMRDDVLSKQIPPGSLEKICEGFKVRGAPINNYSRALPMRNAQESLATAAA